MANIKKQITALISKGKLEEALKSIKEYALAGVTDLDTPATLLSSEFEYMKQCFIKGTISTEDEKVARQNISNRLLLVIDSVKDMDSLASVTEVVNANIPSEKKDIILFLGANPIKNLVLELDREIQEVSKGLTQFGKRHKFDFRAKMHVTPVDLHRLLLETEYSPRFIHFAGNAVVDHPQYGSGVIFEDDKGEPRVISGTVLASVFSKFSGIECVFLNTCDSGPFALDIGQKVKYAIGMNSLIYDESAIVFAVAFYEAIADGKDVPYAYHYAKDRLLLDKYPEQADIPILVTEGKCGDTIYKQGNSHLQEPNPSVVR